jgi:hypothetical protein
MNRDQFERELIETQEQIVHQLKRLCEILTPKRIKHVRTTLMPKSITVGQTATAHIVATGSDGNPFVLSATDAISPMASAPGDITFGTPVFNADGSCDIVVTGVNVDAGDTISASVDGVTSSSDVLTITPVAVTVASATLTLQ